MIIKANTPEEYLAKVQEGHLAALTQLRAILQANLPTGFEEVMIYDAIGYVVPHSIYPAGYHCNPKLPLPFINIASQKNFIAIYHMGIYANPSLLEWFVEAYAQQVKTKLDMGKSCIRFKKPDQIPFDLIATLVQKMSVEDWVTCYESNYKR